MRPQPSLLNLFFLTCASLRCTSLMHFINLCFIHLRFLTWASLTCNFTCNLINLHFINVRLISMRFITCTSFTWASLNSASLTCASVNWASFSKVISEKLSEGLHFKKFQNTSNTQARTRTHAHNIGIVASFMKLWIQIKLLSPRAQSSSVHVGITFLFN